LTGFCWCGFWCFRRVFSLETKLEVKSSLLLIPFHPPGNPILLPLFPGWFPVSVRPPLPPVALHAIYAGTLFRSLLLILSTLGRTTHENPPSPQGSLLTSAFSSPHPPRPFPKSLFSLTGWCRFPFCHMKRDLSVFSSVRSRVRASFFCSFFFFARHFPLQRGYDSELGLSPNLLSFPLFFAVFCPWLSHLC